MRNAWATLCCLALASVLGRPALAQDARSGLVQVTVSEAMGMVTGLTVRSGDQAAVTDARGVARLRLPPGRRVISITRVGFKPARASIDVVADSLVTVDVAVEMAAMTMAEVKVTATRIERLAGDTPTRVEVVDEMEVDENKLMAPSGITMLLNETPGLRVLAASPTLGTGSVRILGLPGQYTAMLADGLPLYGGTNSALGPLDVSPVDLARVEIIKGAASALYGGQAFGGVINLVSKPATGRSEALLNRRSKGVTDGAAWLSRKVNDQVGLSLLISGTAQDGIDIDSDGWLDQARARRWGVRPRLSAADSRGRSLFVTAGYRYDSRHGGAAAGGGSPAGSAFRESLTSRRADIGARAVVPFADSGNLAIRFAVSTGRRSRGFGFGALENEINSTGFLEATRTRHWSATAATLGVAVQADEFRNSLNARFDHRWVTPSLFATGERTVGPLTVSVSARGDVHPAAGTQFTERLALLVKPIAEWSVRVSGGTGFAPPMANSEETEAIGLRALRAGPTLTAERSRGVMLDINGRVAGAELLITTYGSFITDAIRLVSTNDGSGDGLLRNARGTSRVTGVEGAAIWRWEGVKFLGTYGYATGTRRNPLTDAREPMPMLPRHRVGGDLMFEKEGKYRGGIEGIWYGKQPLDDNPYRAESKPYLYAMAIYMRQFGRIEIVANFENLLDVRQTDTHSLVRPTPTIGGRWTTDVWAPLEGFLANVAVRYRW